MLSPLDLAYGAVATDTLRSISVQLEEQAKEEREKHSIAPKPDPVTEARISVSKEAQESRGKIISAMLSHQHVSTNEMVMALADKVAEKLGIDTSKERSYLMLGKIIGDLVEKMDAGTRKALEEAVGLDTLGISISTFASALSDPTGAARQRLDEALLRTAGRGGVTEATSRIVARLQDAADPQSLEEIKAREGIDDPVRPKDASGREEQLHALQSAKAIENLEDVKLIREKLAEQSKETGSGEVTVEDGDLLLLLAGLSDADTESIPADATVEDNAKESVSIGSTRPKDQVDGKDGDTGVDRVSTLIERYLHRLYES
ncbi:hypothetical protein [Peteryoungia ipomoeae]|uniref:Uncharacterized protein n=1 Tax=Peteryoungia ipomoeae TaxID=1210932 RepID=A0A4S8P275_9HYPH|nr:hypothetical protein [Peteryoungia ipomoeae]THV24143.1 hypothetical protein FAA97_09265 [Peteryoungia ipomoeae]